MSYFHDQLVALMRIRAEGSDRVLCIISRGKLGSDAEYNALQHVAHAMGWDIREGDMVCEDGETYPHMIVADRGFTGSAVVVMLQAALKGTLTRYQLQRNLGILFGYSQDSIDEFVGSELSRTCPCDCCGGPDTVEPAVPDRFASPRFVENAYTY